MLKKMGPIGGILGMLPGAGQMKDALAQVDDKDMDRTAAIIQSMTPAERTEPKIINASRRQRIAKGSGPRCPQVNALVDRFFEARKMMSAMAGRFGFPGRGPTTRKRPRAARARRASRPAAARRRRRCAGLPGGFPAMPQGPALGTGERVACRRSARLPGPTKASCRQGFGLDQSNRPASTNRRSSCPRIS